MWWTLLACTGSSGDKPPPPVDSASVPAGDPIVRFEGDPPRNLLMISIDTLRRDHIARYAPTGEAGHMPWLTALMADAGVDNATIDNLSLMGISGAANLLSAIKVAKHYEMGERDVVMTVATDSMEMYGSRLLELSEDRGDFDGTDAAVAHHRYLLGTGLDHVHELGYYDRKRIHNLKYYTWIEQQGKTYEEIQAQWYDDEYWTSIQAMADPIDELIVEFNERVAAS